MHPIAKAVLIATVTIATVTVGAVIVPVPALSAQEPCTLDCPPGAMQEGEPPCVDGYWDVYNGGCAHAGWTLVEAQDGGCATVCGRACTFLYQGMNYRDTDWYEAHASGGAVTMRAVAEFPLEMILIYGADCGDLLYDRILVPACEEGELSHAMEAGARVWFWIAPSVHEGLPESDYLMTVCVIEPNPVPVRDSSWGRVKVGAGRP